MTWITYKEKHMQPIIAKKRIEVVKVVELKQNNMGKFIAFNDDILYKLDETVHRELHPSLEKIDKEELEFFREYNIPRLEEFLEITNGFHCFNKKIENALSTLLPETDKPTIGLLTCYIPKGATYYINEKGEYITDTITPISLFYIITRKKNNPN